MLQTESLGLTFKVGYEEGSAYSELMNNMAQTLQANQTIINKYRKTRQILGDQVNQVEGEYAMYTESCKERENNRVFYDHYRIKLQNLRDKEAERASKEYASSSAYMFTSKTKQ